MNRRFLLIFLPSSLAILAVALLWLAPELGIASWRTPSQLNVLPPAKLISHDEQKLSLALTGSGLDRDTRAWLVPETNQRQAIRKTLQTAGQPRRMALSGTVVYVANNTGGLLLIDVSDWSNPRLLGSMSIPAHVIDLAVRDQIAYLACGLEGLLVVDCSDPLNPKLAHRIPVSGVASTISLGDKFLYLGCGYYGIQAIDISNPTHLLPAGRLDIPLLITDLAVAHDTLVVATGSNGLLIVDKRVPGALRIHGRIKPAGYSQRVVVVNDLIMVGCSSGNSPKAQNALEVYRRTASGSLQHLSTTPLAGAPVDIYSDGRSVDLALADNGVSSYSLLDPAHPELVRRLDNYGRIRSVVSDGDWLLLSARGGKLMLVHTADTLKLPTIGRIPASPPSANPAAVRQFGKRIFVSTRWNTLEIYDVSEPTAPRMLTSIPLAGTLYELLLQDERLWLGIRTQQRGGLLQIWSLQDPEQPKLSKEWSFSSPVGRIAVNERWLVVAEFRNDPVVDPNSPPPPNQPGIIHFYDLLSPAPPGREKQLELPNDPQAISIHGDYLLALSNGTLDSIRLDPSAAPRIVDSLNISWLHATHLRKTFIKIELDTRTAIFPSGDTELAFVDIARPDRMALLGTLEMPGPISTMAMDQDLLLVGLYDLGIAAFDISRPWHPSQLGVMPVPGGSQYFTLDDDMLWLGGHLRYGLVGVPRPKMAFTRVAPRGEELSLEIERPRAAGDYSLWIEKNNQWRELPNCIRFNGKG